jgi:glucokinase
MTHATRLLADIGGTNARFALCTNGRVHDERSLVCAEYPDVESAARRYLKDSNAKPIEAAFAVAAPLHGDLVRMTNHAWQFSVAAVREALGFSRLILLNDFTALALALRHLPPDELQQVGGGPAVPNAPVALIGPGTGLGVSGLIPAGEQWIPLQGEGGHATLAAATDREAAVIEKLRAKFGHVSAERALSGSGLVAIYEAMCALNGATPSLPSPADVTQQGMNNADRNARQSLEMFCAMLGTVASNLALTLGAVGGVYIGGGIVPRLKGFFAQSAFRQRFEDKGRYAIYLAPIPVYVINSEWPAFVGLARAFVDPSPRVVSAA